MFMVVYELMWSGIRVARDIPYEAVKSSLGLPRVPRLVVTITTPLAPLAPKTAVAEASFKTEIVAISLGSMSLKSRSTPSTIIRGWEPFQLDRPRMMISEWSLPGSPLLCMVSTPDNLPAMALVILVVPDRMSCLLSTCVMAPTTLSLRWVPYPTTTTSSSVLFSDTSVTLIVFWVPTSTSWDL